MQTTFEVKGALQVWMVDPHRARLRRLARSATLLTPTAGARGRLPSSGLDPIAAAGRTTIIITHRLSQIRWADLILVLRKGGLAAPGSHHELLRTSEAYRRIFSTTARDYA